MTSRQETEQPQVGRAYAVEVAANHRARVLAARVVAGRCVEVEDCRELLGMLGLADVAGVPVGDPA